MKKILFLLCAIASLQSCKKEITTTEAPVAAITATRSDIDKFISTVNQPQGSFRWSMANDEIIFAALQLTDKIAAIGYKPLNSPNVDNNLHNIDINDADWTAARNQILQIVFEEESKITKDLKPADVQIWEEKYLPVVDVRISNPNTIKRLRATGLLRYLEPMAYEPSPIGAVDRSNEGCGGYSGNTSLLANLDFTQLNPNSKQSWHHQYHAVTQAWTQSTGAGTKIMIIDSGASPNQPDLGAGFNQGASTGRVIEKLVTLQRNWFWDPAETVNDACGHGTCMAGLAAAPRGTDGNAAGVAYNAGLVTVRASTDVYLNESREIKGAADAYTILGNRNDIKISSMSMGKLLYESQIADAISYAYGKGKLMFCAAGTSFSWTAGWVGVIFPANLPQVIAVTGVKTNLTQRCDACHTGSEVAFTVVMEKATNTDHPLSLAMSGTVPTTVGGSSAATATTAGMAALVCSKNPTLTRDQILSKLIRSASNYPTKNGDFGWGRINVNTALNN
jgi:subtilisin family serine protease